MRPETDPWWRQAEADLRSAEVLLQAGQFYAVSWFAQQAAEKAMKALWVEQHQGRLPPRTHDLDLLAAQLGASAILQSDLDALAPVFRISRYPDQTGALPVDAISEANAVDHLDAARRVARWTAGQL